MEKSENEEELGERGNELKSDASMDENFINELREDFILSHFGEEILKLVNLLKETGLIDEFSLSEKFGTDVNHVRSLLYSLYEQKIVSYQRERDKERMWWIYSWVLDIFRVDELLIKDFEQKIQKLSDKKQTLGRDQFFECNGCGERYSFERAVELNFFCPSCGDFLNAIDTGSSVDEIGEKIDDFNKKVKAIRDVPRPDLTKKEEKPKKKAKKKKRVKKTPKTVKKPVKKTTKAKKKPKKTKKTVKTAKKPVKTAKKSTKTKKTVKKPVKKKGIKEKIKNIRSKVSKTKKK